MHAVEAHMNREQILSILYDLSLTIGRELNLDGLLKSTLQRMLFHTSFPVGVVLASPRHTEFGVTATLEKAVGDFKLIERCDTGINVHGGLLNGKVELLSDPDVLRAFSLDQVYTHALRLPVDKLRTIILLAPALPISNLPLTQIFQPVLSSLTK